MSIADRSVTTTWEGPLASGSGTFGQGSSGALDGQTVTWASRTEAPAGKTSPEELAAAAHSSCYSMALSLKLGENKTPPQRLDVSANVSMVMVDAAPTIPTSARSVPAQLNGLDEAAFAKIVDQPSARYLVSRLLADATITVDGALDAA